MRRTATPCATRQVELSVDGSRVGHCTCLLGIYYFFDGPSAADGKRGQIDAFAERY